MASKKSSKFFRGVVEANVNVVKTSSCDPNNNAVDQRPNTILVEFPGQIIGTVQDQEQSDLTQVNFPH